jgi:hypothetical protein
VHLRPRLGPTNQQPLGRARRCGALVVGAPEDQSGASRAGCTAHQRCFGVVVNPPLPRVLTRRAPAPARDRHGGGSTHVARVRAGATSPDAARTAYNTYPSFAAVALPPALAGARLRTSRVAGMPSGGIDRDRDAGDAGDAAAGFGFGDAGRMGAEFVPALT